MNLPVVFSSVSVILTVITAVFSVLAYAKVVGMEKSTHQIQYVPVPDPDTPTQTPDEMAKRMTGVWEDPEEIQRD